MDQPLPVAEAARHLGISRDALYKRIRRNSILWERGEDGRIYVYVDTATDATTPHESDGLTSELKDRIGFLEEEIRFLHQQLERKDAILMTMAQRIPELEPASEPRESPVSASEESAGTQAPPQEQRRSWWRRLFGT